MIKVETFGGETLEHAKKVLAGIPNGVQKAVKGALPRTVSSLRSDSVKAIQTKYDISAENLRTHENIDIHYTPHENGSAAYVEFSGKRIPLYRFNGTYPKTPTRNGSAYVHVEINGLFKTVHPSIPVYAHQLKGTSPKKFHNAFTAEMVNSSGHIGIFERTGGVTSHGKDEIKEIMGLSVPEMIGDKSVVEKFAEGTSKIFEENMEREIERVLNGWGR